MTYKTRPALLGFFLPLCLAAANCGGDPALGTWTNSTLPTTTGNQPYATYMASLTFAEVKMVSATLSTTRTMGALTYAGCTESLMGSGTYTEVGTNLTSTFDTGTIERTGCVYAADNMASMGLDATAKASLVGIASGTFTILEDTLTLKMGSATLTYKKQLQ